jgi:hypothetical protein
MKRHQKTSRKALTGQERARADQMIALAEKVAIETVKLSVTTFREVEAATLVFGTLVASITIAMKSGCEKALFSRLCDQAWDFAAEIMPAGSTSASADAQPSGEKK